MNLTDLSVNPRLAGHAYRYIRKADRLPSTQDALNMGLDAQVVVKLFNPTGSGTWYITGYDPESQVATGVVDLHEVETGDFYMPELEQVVLRFGLGIERDLHFSPVTVRSIVEKADRPLPWNN